MADKFIFEFQSPGNMNHPIQLLLRSIVFLLMVPSMILLVIPYLLISWFPWDFHHTWLAIPGILLMITGITFLFFGMVAFIAHGKGTPAIWFTKKIRWLIGEEPSLLVSRGLYTRTRNPMYLGVVLVLSGEFLFLQKIILLCYCVFIFLFFNLVIIYLEEPHLRKKYGKDFTDYIGRTRRWL
jgi:protein-S-isoprenylcysteine O-methyltransferase Ste14